MNVLRSLGLVFCCVAASYGATVTLIGGDPGGDSSLTNGVRWSDGKIPSPSNDYVMANYNIRTPEYSAEDTRTFYFQGRSFTMKGGLLGCKHGSATVVISNFVVEAGQVMASSAGCALKLAGDLTVPGKMVVNVSEDTKNTHSSSRQLGFTGRVSGTGNIALLGVGVHPADRPDVKNSVSILLNGDFRDFTGAMWTEKTDANIPLFLRIQQQNSFGSYTCALESNVVLSVEQDMVLTNRAPLVIRSSGNAIRVPGSFTVRMTCGITSPRLQTWRKTGPGILFLQGGTVETGPVEVEGGVLAFDGVSFPKKLSVSTRGTGYIGLKSQVAAVSGLLDSGSSRLCLFDGADSTEAVAVPSSCSPAAFTVTIDRDSCSSYSISETGKLDPGLVRVYVSCLTNTAVGSKHTFLRIPTAVRKVQPSDFELWRRNLNGGNVISVGYSLGKVVVEEENGIQSVSLIGAGAIFYSTQENRPCWNGNNEQPGGHYVTDKTPVRSVDIRDNTFLGESLTLGKNRLILKSVHFQFQDLRCAENDQYIGIAPSSCHQMKGNELIQFLEGDVSICPERWLKLFVMSKYGIGVTGRIHGDESTIIRLLPVTWNVTTPYMNENWLLGDNRETFFGRFFGQHNEQASTYFYGPAYFCITNEMALGAKRNTFVENAIHLKDGTGLRVTNSVALTDKNAELTLGRSWLSAVGEKTTLALTCPVKFTYGTTTVTNGGTIAFLGTTTRECSATETKLQVADGFIYPATDTSIPVPVTFGPAGGLVVPVGSRDETLATYGWLRSETTKAEGDVLNVRLQPPASVDTLHGGTYPLFTVLASDGAALEPILQLSKPAPFWEAELVTEMISAENSPVAGEAMVRFSAKIWNTGGTLLLMK